MTVTTKENRLNAAFMTLAEALNAEYDVVELLHTLMDQCVDLLEVEAGGLLLANAHGELELVASTSEGADFVEVMQLNAGAGPCVRCFEIGEAVPIADIALAGDEWADFRDAALLQGFRSLHTVPLRVRDEIIGVMGLFRTHVGVLGDVEADIARALANVASIGILHQRVLEEGAIVAEQLQRALDSRVIIEQAKGVLAESLGVDMEASFRMLRGHARRNNLTLRDVAESVVDRSLRIAADGDAPGPAR